MSTGDNRPILSYAYEHSYVAHILSLPWKRYCELRGEWSCTTFELQVMRDQRGGPIVNSSSPGGLVGGYQRGTCCAAKHGSSAHQEHGVEYVTRGIRVNAVYPGRTRH